ncbi:MAG: hypothetical protein ACRDHS_01800 [Actinomycetota bacterium]
MASPIPDGAGFAFDVARTALDEQLRRIEALDGKAGILIAAGGVLAGFLFGRGSLLFDAPRLILGVAAITLTGSLVLALLAFWTRRYDLAPRPEALSQLMAAREEWLKWRFIPNALNAIAVSRRKPALKSALLTWALVCLIAAVLLLGGYFVYAQFWNRVRL